MKSAHHPNRPETDEAGRTPLTILLSNVTA